MIFRLLRTFFAPILTLLAVLFYSTTATAACGATTATWDGGDGTNGTNGNYWSTASIWDNNNRPDTAAENAVVPSAGVGYLWMYPTNRTVGCVEVTSGLLGFYGRTLTVSGDYFRALTPSSVYYGVGTGRITMAGTGAQTLEMVDTIPNLTISNNTSVTFTDPFKSLNAPVMSGTTTTLFIDAAYEIVNNSAWTIPSGVTVEIRNGSTVSTGGNITVNGTLIVDPGGTLEMATGRTLSVPAGGLIQLNGGDGNPSSILTAGGGTFTFNVAGSFSGEYFNITRTAATGVNITGTIQKMENGEFHYIANGGYAVTIGAAATLPFSGSMDGLGFFDENGTGTGNFNASAYSGTASEIALDDWLGDLGGDDFDNENAGCGTDPPGCFEFLTEAPTVLTMTNNTVSGSPPASLGANSADTLFGTYAFALTKDDVDSDITSLTITQTGTASITEVGDVKFYDDGDGNCVYNAGTDTQIGGDLNLTGTPQQATVTIPATIVRVTDTAPVCIHLVSSTSTLAVRNNTISFEVSATEDVVNSNSYAFSASSGPPVNTGLTAITDGFASQWTGNTSTNSTTTSNWFLNDPPSATENCQVGPGERNCVLNADLICKTADLPTGGTLDFNGNDFDVFGNLTVDAGYTFLNSGARQINMIAAVNQGMEMGQAFPGNLVINNTGGAGDDQVILTGNSEIQGNVTVTNGTLNIGNGVTLTVGGNMSIATGGEVVVEAGGEIVFSDGSVLTVDLGGTLTLVGSGAATANISSINTSSAYTVVVNGNIAARYYNISRLGANGVTINSGATIDGTNHLQNGSFGYPVDASTTLLRLFRAIPTNTMDNMNFETGGSPAATPLNIYTDAAIGVGPLVINTYSGDISGPTFDNENTYLISWIGATNTLDMAQDATSPASVAAGDSVNMGRWSFEQSLAGASFNDTDITSFKVTMTGTGNSSDVDDIKIYYDDDCDSSGGTLLGTQSPSGSPGATTFTLGALAATIEADLTTPPTRCIYVEYDLASGAADGKTIGAKLTASSSIVNSEAYAPSGGTSFPISLGTSTIAGSSTTIWTGTTSTNWFTASNWSAGLPSTSKSCEIPSTANNPVINAGTAICDNVDITGGSVTWVNGTGAALEVYGNFENVGTLIQNDGTFTLRDDGATVTNQRIESSTNISNLTFNKTAGGEIQVGGATTVPITTLNLPGSQNFTFVIASGETLSLGQSVSIPAGITYEMEGSSTLEMASGTTVTVAGGIFQTLGVNDAYPQATGNKALITTSSGRFSFVASSGTVSLQGFLLNNLTVNGLQINGSANLSKLDGGQFTNLLTDFATPVRALTLNTSATISETTASNVGFNWGAANSTYSAPTSPDPTDNYYLVYGSDCGSQSLAFSQWYGDFWGVDPQPVTQDKILDSADGPNTCTVTIDASASPVTLTALDATPYNGVIDVQWTTGAEIDHLGFNVYRSENVNSGFVQINSKLIKNLVNAGDLKGTYIFRDQTVTNTTTYYYYVEDIAFNGTTTMHGPVSAMPLASLASAPALDSPSGSDDINDDATDADPSGGDVIEIAPDVHIVSSSSSTFRLVITPSAETTEVSTWDGSYNTIHIPHFSHITQVGHPEVLERTVLIPVDEPQTGVSSEIVTLDQDPAVNMKIAPAPDWNLVNGALEPSWALDSSIYEQNQYFVENFYEVQPDTINVGNKYFMAVKVWPVGYNPVTEQYVRATKIVLDVFTGDTAWENPSSPLSTLDSPLNADNIAILAFHETGMYEVSFDDLVTMNADGPFINSSASDLRAYFNNQEIPIEVQSADATFNSGDTLRVYGLHSRSMEDDRSRIVLSPRDLYGVGGSALRIPDLSAPPDPSSPTADLTDSRVVVEENNMAQFDKPMGGHVDHYFWTRMFVNQGTAGAATAKFSFDIDLKDLNSEPGLDVYLNFDLRGRGTDYGSDPVFKVQVTLNDDASPLSIFEFAGTQKQIQSVPLPSMSFRQGINTVHLEVLADNLSNGNEIAIIDLDKVEATYNRSLYAATKGLDILRREFDSNLRILGYSTEPHVYDVSVPSQVQKIISSLWTPPGADASEYWFKAPSGFLTAPNGDPLGISGTKFFAVDDTQFLSVDEISIGKGFGTSLKDSSLQADYIIIGSESALASAAPLATYREGQGLKTSLVPLQQIYNEFSNGQRSAPALRKFLTFAQEHWTSPKVKYVLFVGDSTTDPLNHEGYGVPNFPMSSFLVQGEHSDFPSDVILASEEHSNGSWVPTLAVGRIPTEDHQKITDFIDKIIAYENGDRLADSGRNKISFISDKSVNSEGFEKLSNNLKQTVLSSFSALQGEDLHKNSFATEEEMNQAMKDVFNVKKPLLISLNGHGAENMWSSMNTFVNADAESLTNSDSHPIVLSFNCQNGFHQFADPTAKGLGESLLMQKNGAIAFWGSTALTTPRVQEALATNFFAHMGQQMSARNLDYRIGDSVLTSQRLLNKASGFQDVLLSWSFYGDPAMKLPTKVFAAPELNEEQEESPQTLPAGSHNSSSGCSVFAGNGAYKQKTPWDLVFGFGLEIFLFLWLIRLCALFVRRED